MISSIVAFGIFITNPTGIKGAPYDNTVRYIAEGKKVPATFSDNEDCLDELKDVRKDLKKKVADLEAISGHEADSADEETFNTEINSMRCLGFNRFGKVVEPDAPAVTKTAGKAKSEVVEVWRIGRYDSEHVFHGTAYDTKIYDDEATCMSGHRKAARAVADRAVREGASGAQTTAMVGKFRATYNCEQITISLKAYEDRMSETEVMEEPAYATRAQAYPQQPQVAEQPAYADVPQSPQMVEAQPQSGYYQVPAPPSIVPPSSPVTQYRNYPMGLPRVPTRPYYMAENTRGYDGTWRWVKYQSVFQSPAQCWQAVREFLSGEEQNIQRSYSAMQSSYAAADWYRTSMDALTYRRTHLSCVTSDN